MPDAGPTTFLRDQSGAIAGLYGLALFALVAMAGVAWDWTRLAAMDSELQNAADQAALAGAAQIDGEPGTCARASAEAAGMLSNSTLLANDDASSGTAITVTDEPECDAVGMIRFWQDRDATTAADDDTNARFIEVTVDGREAFYAFTPLVGALRSGVIEATALAGIGSSICKTPPLMMCNPNPGAAFDAESKIGIGVRVTAKGAASWGPGDFGFLEVGAGQKADIERALAFEETPYDCAPIEGGSPQTGNAQGLFRAVNTRFDIYDTTGNPLGNCQSSDCPPAQNVMKDLVKPNANTGGNACRTHNQGWQLPPANRRFWPKAHTAIAGTPLEQVNDPAVSPSLDALGLSRDLCHYDSYGRACSAITGYSTSHFGNGNWARGDYFTKYHSGRVPAGAASMTRFETYEWELENGYNAQYAAGSSPSRTQFGAPVCSALSSSVDRRLLTVAIVKNCSMLAGGSVPVDVDEWVEMFLVEPVFDARGNGSVADTIYMEVVGPAKIGDDEGGSDTQSIRRDVPYLVR